MIDSEETPPPENEENGEEDDDDDDDDDYEEEEVDDDEEEEYPALLLNNLSNMLNHASLSLFESSSSTESNETSSVRVPTTFDKTLPAKHEYLGTDLEELRGRTLLDEGSIVHLPILMELEIVLVPGQTLPLTAVSPPTITMFRKIIAKDKTFGVISVNGASPYGTTAEIFQYQFDSDLKLNIKAKGRQRFKVLDKTYWRPGISSQKVLILPEISLVRPLHSPRFASLDRYRNNCSMRGKLSCFDAAPTPWPSWVYRQYDSKALVDKVIAELRNSKTDISSSALPTNPIDLSYWVAQCLPIDGKHRIKMLSFNTPIERLQYALKSLSADQNLYCSFCGNCIADGKDVFSMSIDGPQGMYCNPGGYVHEIITVYNGTGMSLMDDRPSLEHTWFPGYGWTIAQCSTCDRHMGWLFTATETHLKPMKFWGLSRKSVSTHRKFLTTT